MFNCLIFCLLFLFIAFSWKKVALRYTIYLCMLLLSVLFPFMQPVMSLIGAVPVSLITLVYPIIIYYFTFNRISLIMKIVLTTIIMATVVFMFGATYFSLKSIVEMSSSFTNWFVKNFIYYFFCNLTFSLIFKLKNKIFHCQPLF